MKWLVQAWHWLKKRVFCRCMVDTDGDGKPDAGVQWSHKEGVEAARQ